MISKRIVTREPDLAYVRSQFRAVRDLTELDPDLPAPAYYDLPGTAYVPHEYERQESDPQRFARRAAAEIERTNAGYDAGWIERAWASYRDGIYSICLREASPENIVRKNGLIDDIEAMLRNPNPSEAGWLTKLGGCVDALDALERPFCAFDREYFGGSVSRDRCITAVRGRYFRKQQGRR